MEKVSLEIPILSTFLYPDKIFKELKPILEEIKKHAEKRIALNAPIDTGDFRKSLFVEYYLDGKNIIFDFGSTAPILQTLRLHEGEYKLGERSRVQPGTAEGGVGNKFIMRVIEYWATTWLEMIGNSLLRIIDR